MKRILKKIITFFKNFDRYYKVRYTGIGIWFHSLLFPKIRHALKSEDILYKKLLAGVTDQIIFDIGANLGHTTNSFLKTSNKVVAVEPASHNFKILTYRFGGNPKVILVKKAIDRRVGKTKLFLQKQGNALHTLNEKRKDQLENSDTVFRIFESSEIVLTTTLKELIKEHGKPHLLKVDIEGHELALFEDLEVVIPIIIFEANLPDFMEETKTIIDIIHGLNPNVSFSFFDGYIYYNTINYNKEEMYAFLSQTEMRYLDIICHNRI